MDDNDLRKQIQKAVELYKLLNNTGKKYLVVSVTKKENMKIIGIKREKNQ